MRCCVPQASVSRVVLVWSVIVIGMVLAGCGNADPARGAAAPPQALTESIVTRPTVGYVWGAGGTGLRQVRGVTGASYFGPRMYADYANAVTAGNAGHALVTRSNGDIALVRLPDGIPQTLTQGLSPGQHIVMSPTGSAAVVYANAADMLLITGLPDAPTVETVPAAPLGGINAVAVSDKGSLLVAASKNGKLLLSSRSIDGTLSAIPAVTALGGMSFLASSEDALLADSSQNAVWLAKGLSSIPTLTKMASASDGINRPVAVSGSADRRWAFIVNGQTRTILRLDLAGQQPAVTIKCPCAPSELVRMAGNAVFRLNSGSSVPVWVLDGDAETPKTFFIPAPAATAAN